MGKLTTHADGAWRGGAREREEASLCVWACVPVVRAAGGGQRGIDSEALAHRECKRRMQGHTDVERERERTPSRTMIQAT